MEVWKKMRVIEVPLPSGLTVRMDFAKPGLVDRVRGEAKPLTEEAEMEQFRLAVRETNWQAFVELYGAPLILKEKA